MKSLSPIHHSKISPSKYVTGSGKTGLIYTKYTCLYNCTYLLFCIRYLKSVSFIEFLMDVCIYDNIFDAIRIANKKLLHFKLSKSGQIQHVDKTCFPWPVTYVVYMHVQLQLYICMLQVACTKFNQCMVNTHASIHLYCNQSPQQHSYTYHGPPLLL